MATGGEGAVEGLWHGFKHDEIVKLLIQTLEEIGYGDIAQKLEEQSGISLRSSSLTSLRRFIMSGSWFDSQQVISCMRLPSDVQKACIFFISEHKFLELCTDQNGDIQEILKCLRTHRVHRCASLLTYKGDKRLYYAKQLSSLSRSHLFLKINYLLPPTAAVPPSRLATLITLGFKYEKLCCPLHDEEKGDVPSLLLTHICEKPLFPRRVIAALNAHNDEVWTVSASPVISNGSVFFASGSKDKSLRVWRMYDPTNTLKTDDTSRNKCLLDKEINKSRFIDTNGNDLSFVDNNCENSCENDDMCVESSSRDGKKKICCQCVWQYTAESRVECVAWHESGEYIAASTDDGCIYVWESKKDLLCTVHTHTGSIVALHWIPNTMKIISAGNDRCIDIHSINKIGNFWSEKKEHFWGVQSRPIDCAVLYKGDAAVVFLADRSIKIFDLETKSEVYSSKWGNLVVCACASKTSNQVLLSRSDSVPAIRLWDVAERRVVRKYQGHTQGRLVIRCAFGGKTEQLVLSGSEDAQIFIWHRLWGTLLLQLRGHVAPVNDVAWLPGGVGACLVSASDDGSILAWSDIDAGEPEEIM